MMRIATFFLALTFALDVLPAIGLSIDEFRTPPQAVRPWAYWWWLNGHVDEETITDDLEDLKALGFGGLLQFDSRGYWEDEDHPAMERPRNEFLDADWRRNLVFAAKKAKSLGLEFTMNLSSSAGWLQGPWDIGKGEDPRIVDVTDRAQVEEYFRRFTDCLREDFGDELSKYVTHFYACSFEGRLEKLPETASDEAFAARNRRYLDNFYRPMVENSHRLGIRWYSESGGPWNRDRTSFGLANQLDFLLVNDMPMGEFWVSAFPGFDRPKYMYKGAVSAAHAKGAKRAAAEAFTHMTYHWSVYPAQLKAVADSAFADGINHLVWHTYTASPKRYGAPGYEYFAGTHINRGVTWHDDLAPFVEYLARCQYLLQQGEPVVDYTIGGGPYPYQCAFDPRLNPMDGSGIRVWDGLTYDVVASERPETQEEVDAKCSRLVKDYEGRFDFCHRRTAAGEDIYFLDGSGEELSRFRVRGKSAALWNPVDGSVVPVAARPTGDGRTAVRIRLPENGSVFVVFSDSASARPQPEATVACRRTIGGPWEISFRNKGLRINEPQPIRTGELFDFTASTVDEIRHFAGTATYTTSFRAEDPRTGTWLSLGLVLGGLAHVYVNGVDCGTAWCEPWEVRIPDGALKAGDNRLRVDYTGTWANRFIGDAALPEERRTTRSNLKLFKGGRTRIDNLSGWGTRPTVYGGYCEKDPLVPSGLMGPVTLQ